MHQAATVQGIAAARVTMPALPEDLRKQEPNPVLKVGEDPYPALRAKGKTIDRLNARVARFGTFWDNTAAALK